MKTCPFCGKQVEDAVIQCPACLSWAGPAATSAPAAAASPSSSPLRGWAVYEPEPWGSENKGRLGLDILVSIFILAVVYRFSGRLPPVTLVAAGVLILLVGASAIHLLFLQRPPQAVALSPEGIAEWKDGAPGVVLAWDEMTSVSQERYGVILVRGGDPERVIRIDCGLKDLDGLVKRLAEELGGRGRTGAPYEGELTGGDVLLLSLCLMLAGIPFIVLGTDWRWGRSLGTGLTLLGGWLVRAFTKGGVELRKQHLAYRRLKVILLPYSEIAGVDLYRKKVFVPGTQRKAWAVTLRVETVRGKKFDLTNLPGSVFPLYFSLTEKIAKARSQKAPSSFY